jgi:hypothetical protein
MGHLPNDQAIVRLQVNGHTHIHHHHLRPYLTGQNIYARPAADKIIDHLRGNFAGKETDPFFHHPMIAGKDRYCLFPEGRSKGPPDPGNPLGALFKPAQAAPGYCHSIKALAGLLQQGSVKRNYGVQNRSESLHTSAID